jgi:hypothetical protein
LCGGRGCCSGKSTGVCRSARLFLLMLAGLLFFSHLFSLIMLSLFFWKYFPLNLKFERIIFAFSIPVSVCLSLSLSLSLSLALSLPPALDQFPISFLL